MVLGRSTSSRLRPCHSGSGRLFAADVGAAIDRASGASTGAVHRVVDFLERQDLLGREPRKPITRVDWREILKRRSRDFNPDPYRRSTRPGTDRAPRLAEVS